MASSGLSRLLARAASRLRVPAGARTTAESGGWRSLLARTAARLRSTPQARNDGAAAACSKAKAVFQMNPKCEEKLRSKEISLGANVRRSPSKVKSKCEDTLRYNDIFPKTNAKISPSKAHSNVMGNPRLLKAKQEVLSEITEVATPPTQKMGVLEELVLSAEKNVTLAIRFSNVLKGAGTAFSNVIQAISAFVLGTSLLVYHKDKLCENYEKLKDLLPGASGTSPPTQGIASAHSTSTPAAASPAAPRAASASAPPAVSVTSSTSA